jgi:hypothetical protein
MTKIKNLLGVALISAPFIAIGVAGAVLVGWALFIPIGMGALAVASILTGAWLLEDF